MKYPGANSGPHERVSFDARGRMYHEVSTVLSNHWQLGEVYRTRCGKDVLPEEIEVFKKTPIKESAITADYATLVDVRDEIVAICKYHPTSSQLPTTPTISSWLELRKATSHERLRCYAID